MDVHAWMDPKLTEVEAELGDEGTLNTGRPDGRKQRPACFAIGVGAAAAADDVNRSLTLLVLQSRRRAVLEQPLDLFWTTLLSCVV